MQNDQCGIKTHLLVTKQLCVVSRLQVKLCSNTAKRYWLAMAVDVEGVGNEIGTLPINARLDTLITHLALFAFHTACSAFSSVLQPAVVDSHVLARCQRWAAGKKLNKTLEIVNFAQAATAAWQQASNIILRLH